MSFLKVQGKKIVDGQKAVQLRGVNLGGWLMPEGYIMHARNLGVQYFRAEFEKALGKKVLVECEKAFRDNFIQKSDFKRVKNLGVNHIRLPFHYGLIETKPYQYSEAGLAYMDQAIKWAKMEDLKVILDLHAAPGAQNHDWHSDSDGHALFWKNKEYRNRALVLWEFLADRYKGEEGVLGYDLLNETVLADSKLMNQFYQNAIKAIRSSDKNHIIFVEGNHWAQDIACLDDFSDDNLVFGIHFYEPLEFTFNFIPGLKYPLGSGKTKWDKIFMKTRLEGALKIAQKKNRPLWCGEFGVTGREGEANEDGWLKDVLSNFKSLDIHWTYWTFKAMKNHMFPDGVYSYYPNDPWVNRPGPKFGWETWSQYWPTEKKKMAASWQTKNFTLNQRVAKEIQNAC